MTEKKNKSSKLSSTLKKGARKLLSGEKGLAKFAATLPLLALFVEEVKAAQAKGYKPTPELLQALPPEVLTELGVEVPPVSADEKSSPQNVADDATLEQKIQSARESLRAVLDDEIANAQVTASATKIDPSAPDAGHQAVRSVLNDEVSYEVGKALEASPNAAEALAKLPDLNLPQTLASNLSGLPLGGGAAAVAAAALSGGGAVPLQPSREAPCLLRQHR
jgi:hypothetical protein